MTTKKDFAKRIVLYIFSGFTLFVFILLSVGLMESGAYLQSGIALILGVLSVYRKNDLESIFKIKKWKIITIVAVGFLISGWFDL